MIEMFKKDNTGKIRYWKIETSGDSLLIHYGYLGGALTSKETPVVTNLSGRGLDQQIVLEMDSRIQKQLDKGYVFNLKDAHTKNMTNAMDLPLPMLAQPVNRVRNLAETHYAQYKYDGMRCLVHAGDTRNQAYSRGGKAVDTIRHITEKLKLPRGVTVDGELYIHGTPLQSIMSLAKRYQPGTEELRYIVYDIIMDKPYNERYQMLKELVAETDSIKIAPTSIMLGTTNIKNRLEAARELGYEGLILRNLSTPYEAGKRSPSLIKVKAVEDEIFVIDKITTSKDGHAILHCENFSVLAPGSHENKIAVACHADDYVGSMVRVEFANRTKDGVPFHPVATNFIEEPQDA